MRTLHEEQGINSSKKHNTQPVAMSLYRKLREGAENFPDNIALQIKENGKYTRITYAEMLGTVDGLARAMMRIGITKGGRVAIFSENRPEWAIALFAINRAGAIAVPLDTQLTHDEIQNLLSNSGSKLIFTSGSLVKAISRIEAQTKTVSFDENETFSEAISQSREKMDDADFTEVLPDDQALLLYTSGTTGTPKGVMLSNLNLTSNADGLYQAGICSHRDNFISVLPLHHAYPLMLNLILPLSCGACATFARSLKRTELGECVRETGGTFLIGVPQLYALFNDGIVKKIQELPLPVKTAFHTLRSLSWALRRLLNVNAGKLFFKSAHAFFGPQLRFLVSGGARLDPAVEKNLLKLGFTVMQGYGLTETSPVVAFTRKGRARIGSVGRPLPGVDVRIDSPNEAGEGQIMVRGPNVMMGYYHDEEGTAAIIKDGWLETGDLGYMDTKRYLFITGRLKEVIVLPSGMNVYPEEVENHYLKSKYLKEICVFPGEKGGLFALILPDFDYMKERGEVYSHDVVRWQVEDRSIKLPPYKRITGYEIIQEPLPRTRLGKIKRNLVMQSVDQLTGKPEESKKKPLESEYDLELLASDKAHAVISLLNRFTGGDKEIGLDNNLELDLGIDSLSRIQLITDVEEAFGEKIPDETGARIITVKDLIEAVSGSPALKKPAETEVELSWSEILKGEPLVRLDDIIPQEPGPFGKTIRFTAYKLLRLFSLLYFRVSIRGIENIPRKEPFILCPNHVSFFDSPILGSSLPYPILRRLYFVALTPFFSGRSPLKIFVKILRIIMTDSSVNLLSSMQLAAQVVEKGLSLCIFPEGARSADGRIQTFKKGVGILAKELNVPLVPVQIDGTYGVLPKGTCFPKPKKVRITIGEPIRWEKIDIDKLRSGNEDDYEVIAEYLRKAIINLKNIPLKRNRFFKRKRSLGW